MEKDMVKVFMIHRWDMADLQAKISKILKSDKQVIFIDNSYTCSSPAEKDEFIQEYACGMMIDSDIVLVLPDSAEEFYDDKPSDECLSDLSHDFGHQRGLDHNAVYVTEIKTLMFDACDNVPVLVLGWSKENAEHIADILRSPKGIGGRIFEPNRFFSMGLNEISDESDLPKRIVKIVHKRPARPAKLAQGRLKISQKVDQLRIDWNGKSFSKGDRVRIYKRAGKIKLEGLSHSGELEMKPGITGTFLGGVKRRETEYFTPEPDEPIQAASVKWDYGFTSAIHVDYLELE